MKFSEIELPNSELINVNDEYHINPVISISDKYDIVMETLEQSLEPGGLYNEIKLNMFLHLNLIYKCTDIDFTEEEKLDPYHLYNVLDNTGIINTVISKIPNEYKEILDYLEKNEKKLIAYQNSITGAFASLVNMLPEGAAAMKEIMDTFDMDKYKEITNAFTSLGGDNQ